MKTVETYRGFICPGLHHAGHMSMHSLASRFEEASWHFMAKLGLTPGYLKLQRRSVMALDQHTRYRLEVLEGSLLEIHTQLLESGHKTLRYLHRMMDTETLQEVATMELLVALLDTEARRNVALPENVLSCAEKMKNAH